MSNREKRLNDAYIEYVKREAYWKGWVEAYMALLSGAKNTDIKEGCRRAEEELDRAEANWKKELEAKDD